MVTCTAASRAQTILESNCFHEAASTAEGHHRLPGAGPGEVAGTCVKHPAAVKQLSCFSPTASSECTSAHQYFCSFSEISTPDPWVAQVCTKIASLPPQDLYNWAV